MVASASTSPALPSSRQPFPRSLLCSLLLAALVAVLLVDSWLLHYPQGAVTWRLLSGKQPHGPSAAPAECWWDYEGGWRVGQAVGFSPGALQLVAPPPSSLSASSAKALSGFSCADIPVTHQRRITFVADPFLLVPTQPSSAPPSSSASPSPLPAFSAVPWYLFFEQKNVAVQPARGELGAAQSLDNGHSWQYVGELLSDIGCHLSYPFVLYDHQHAQYVLIPETHELREVRLYTTTAAALPLGWTYQRSPLRGAAYVDCSVVWQPSDETWYIFATVDNTLQLFHTDDLVTGVWQPHPASPVYTHHRSYGRNAGRPVVFDGVVHRFAQEQTNYYGEGVRVMRINRLSHSRFEEMEMAFMQPTAHSWPHHRLHHVDAVAVSAPSLLGESTDSMSRFMAAGGAIETPMWLAVVDGDDQAVDELLWREEGWFIQLKRALLLPVLLLLAITLYSAYPVLAQLEWRRFANSCRSRVPFNAVGGRQADDELPLLQGVPSPAGDIVYKVTIGHYQPEHTGRLSGWLVVRHLLWQVALFLLLVSLVMAVPTFIRLPSSPTASTPLPTTTTADGESLIAVGSMVETAVPTDGSVWVVTAASSVYFDRLRNFVGSMHTFAVGVPVLVYDLGLSAEQRQQMVAWRNVSVRAFPFHDYPQHVRNLFSYSWKLLIHHRAFSDLPSHAQRIIVLDSGLELRSHIALPRIAETLARQGYWMASQGNTIDRMAHPLTLQRLNISFSMIVDKQFCAGGLAGWRRGSAAYEQLVGRAYRCAMDEHCILPPGAGHSNHRHDQVVMSALIYATGRYCDKERQWREWDMTSLTEDEAEDGEAQTPQRKTWISARRWHQPKPYAHRVSHVNPTSPPPAASSAATSDSSFPNDCLTRPGMSLALPDWVPLSSVCSHSSHSTRSERLSSRRLFSEQTATGNVTEAEARSCVEGLVLSTLDNTKLDFNDELRLCLLSNHNSRWSCRDAILRHWERLNDDANDALCVAEQMTAMQYELSHSILPLHFTLPPVRRLLAAQQQWGQVTWLLGDLVLTPMARRAQQWRYYWMVLVLQLACFLVQRWWSTRRKGLPLLSSSVVLGGSGERHRRYS